MAEEKEPRKSRSGKPYPASDPSKRGTGNKQRKVQDPNLRLDTTGDLTDLGVHDAKKGGKVKSSGFKAPTRKTRPQKADGSMPKPPAEKTVYRVRPAGESVQTPLTPHHQALLTVINGLNSAIRGVDNDRSHQEALRRTLQTARDANDWSARFHNDNDRTSAIAEMVRAAGSLRSVHSSIGKHPIASQHPDYDPEVMGYVKNVVDDYKQGSN